MAGLVASARPPGASDLDLAAIRAFLAVVEHHHFGRAAQSLSVAASTVTKRVARLESSLGTPLLDRDSGGVIGLTEAGLSFQHYAADILRSAFRAEAAVRRGFVTTLRIAMPAGAQMAAPMIAAELTTLETLLALAHPGIRLALSPTRFDAINAELFAQRADIALMAGELKDSRLVTTQLGELQRIGLVGPTHPYAMRSVVEAREFADQPMLRPTGLADQYMDPFLLADVRPLDQATLVPVAATSAAEIVQRLLLGREVTVVPTALAANLPRGINRITLAGAPPFPFAVVRRRGDDRPELLALIDLLIGFTETLTRTAAF